MDCACSACAGNIFTNQVLHGHGLEVRNWEGFNHQMALSNNMIYASYEPTSRLVVDEDAEEVNGPSRAMHITSNLSIPHNADPQTIIAWWHTSAHESISP